MTGAGGAAEAEPAPARTGRGRRALLAITAVVAVLALGLGYAGGRLSTLGDRVPPSNDGVEAGFARDMQTHHNQGVEMALLIRDRSDDEAVRLLAYDIATTQGNQSGQMFGWLAVWGLPQYSAQPSMTWMNLPLLEGSHEDHQAHAPGEPMPGLATSAQMAELSAATGVEADRIFLRLMIAHHQGALEMAEAAIVRTRDPLVTAFCRAVIASQQKEIDLMEDMLAAKG